MNRKDILALALKPAMRVTKSVIVTIVLLLAATLIAIIMPSAVSARPPCGGATVTQLVTGLDMGVESAKGSTVGPDGALYVTEGVAGRISRVDPQTGEKTTFASGLPPAIISIGGAFIGGAIDVAFIDNEAYALVTLVSPDVGGTHVYGIVDAQFFGEHARTKSPVSSHVDTPEENDQSHAAHCCSTEVSRRSGSGRA